MRLQEAETAAGASPVELEMPHASFPEPSPSGNHWVMPGREKPGALAEVKAGRRAGKERRGSIELSGGLLGGRRSSLAGESEPAFLGEPGTWNHGSSSPSRISPSRISPSRIPPTQPGLEQVRAGRRAGKERRGSIELTGHGAPTRTDEGNGGLRVAGRRRGSVNMMIDSASPGEVAVPAAGLGRGRRRRSVNMMAPAVDVDAAFADLDLHLGGGP